MLNRRFKVERKTRETSIEAEIRLDGNRRIAVSTGIGFLDHMFTSLAYHAGWDLELRCAGDLVVDDHHTAEDCALVIGQAIAGSIGERAGIRRFGWAYAPLDESLARAVVDISGRPWPQVDLGLRRERIGSIACENLTHVFTSMAMAMGAAVHVDVLRGENDHHRAEAAFKALALALRQALGTAESSEVPSTKGCLEDSGGG